MTRNIVEKSTRTLRKLRRMSAREVRCRCGQVARRAIDRRLWRQIAPSQRCPAISTTDFLQNVVRIVPGTARRDLSILQDSEHAFYEQMTRSAKGNSQAISSGHWRMLGHEYDMRGPIEWNRDPRSSFQWDRTFYADLSLYELPAGVDVKYVWELGRQQYVVELARTWLLTGDERTAEQSRSFILDWIKENPLYEGVHWTSGLEVAMRAISWIWAVAALADWGGWKGGELDRIVLSLEDHATYLEHHFSFYSSPYNHLIGEATALLLISYALDGASTARRWRRYSRTVLAEYGPSQFYDDGFCVEQATGYHFYTLGFLSQAIVATRATGKPMPELEASVRRAFMAGAAFRRPDGRWPAIGDLDSARSIPVHHKDFWSFDSLCQLGAVLFEEQCLKRDSVGPGEETYWLLGASGVDCWHSLESRPGPNCVHLPVSGYVMASYERDWFLFDAGPVAEGLHPDATPSVAHGHADVFQVLYQRGGEDVLLDSGMPFYGGGQNDWVAYFRSAAAHNTLEIEGAGPVTAAGSLAWSNEESTPAMSVHLTDAAWLASGRADWHENAVSVERHVLVLPGQGMLIADLIRTDRPRTVRWHWHSRRPFTNDSSAPARSATPLLQSIPLDVRTCDGALPFMALRRQDQAPQSRVCDGYGECSCGTTVRVTSRVERDVLVVTRIGMELPYEVRCGGYVVADALFGETDCLSTSVHSHDGVCWRIATESDAEIEEFNPVKNRGVAATADACSGEKL